MITLIAIPGISEEHEYDYTGEKNILYGLKQYPYKEIDVSFYPPFWHNKIKLTSDDINFSNFNYTYLSLKYDERDYFFFISDLAYISEDVIELSLTLDTWLTYRDSINSIRGTLKRGFIDRYTDFTNRVINRNYIRENVSRNNNFVYSSRVLLNNDFSTWALIGSFSNISNAQGVPIAERQNAGSTIGVENYMYSNAGCLFMVPLFKTYFTYHKVDSSTGEVAKDTTTVLIGPENNFYKYTYIPQFTALYIIPFNPFLYIETKKQNSYTEWVSQKADGEDYDKITISPLPFDESLGHTMNDNYVLYSTPTLKPFTLDTSNTDLKIIFNDADKIEWDSKVYSDKISGIDFFGTIHKDKTEYDYSYCPALFDNNYINLTFGTDRTSTTIPLEELTTQTVYYSYYADLFTGSRFYALTSSKGDFWTPKRIKESDVFKTLVIDNNILNLNLSSDAYTNYVANNNARWGSAIFNSVSGLLQGVGTTAAMSFLNPALGVTSAISTIGKAAGGFADQVFAEKNARHAPDGIKGTNSATSYLSSIITYTIERKQDIAQCGMFYHKYGYLLKKPIELMSSEYLNNRYYYNYIQFESVDVITSDSFVVTQKIKEDLIRRLTQGITLWHADNETGKTLVNIGDYTYDNTERSLINE